MAERLTGWLKVSPPPRWFKTGPSVTQVVNMFGTTETQRSVGYFEVPRGATQLARLKEIIPCGRGMKDVALILLPERLCSVFEPLPGLCLWFGIGGQTVFFFDPLQPCVRSKPIG